MLSRRQLCALSSGLLVPRRLLAAPAAQRRFLFLFCDGGWDVSYVFSTAALAHAGIDTESDATAADVGGLSFVDVASRPTVRAFFEAYGDRCCILNGLEVPSITHERCSRLVMTGSGEGSADDWGAILAAHGGGGLALPHLVLSGPSYTGRYTSQVVRVGQAGQFPDLLSGDALSLSDASIHSFDADNEALGDALIRSRAERFARSAPAGQPAVYGASIQTVLSQLQEVGALRDVLAFGEASAMQFCGDDPISAFTTLLSCFELGITRCGTVQYSGWCQNGWDTHSNNEMQGTHFEELFTILTELVGMLQARPGQQGGTMLDDVCVVVLSEMGRHPQLNVAMGKNHWTTTSALLLGAGISGGRVIGELDADFIGHPVDLTTGETTASGTALTAAHLGATLLALGDVDPGAYLDGTEPIAALMDGG